MCMPGDNVVMDVELITPIAIEEGLRFAIREGGRTVGSGVVTAINEYLPFSVPGFPKEPGNFSFKFFAVCLLTFSAFLI